VIDYPPSTTNRANPNLHMNLGGVDIGDLTKQLLAAKAAALVAIKVRH